ncbi:MAG: bifunctional phosphoribosylaminoimidazolecarboxamide formyltransferase/IMP cyclohydrolase [Pseudomonadota bacterium]
MNHSLVPIKNALISVSDKTNLEPLCRKLHEWGVTIFSTGGTARFIESLGVPIRLVEELTQTPEMLEGRVKTLNPRIFGGILARRDHPGDLSEIEAFKLTLFDLVVVNFYPFQDHFGKSTEEQTSFIDIGGPSLVRAASKNHRWVTVLSSPNDYSDFLSEASPHQGVELSFRFKMAKKSFLRVSQYDRSIFGEWEKSDFPQLIDLSQQKVLRYGENPHQAGAWCGSPDWQVLQGKEISFNNLLDSEAACQLVADFSEGALAIIKHNNPCGVAWGTDPTAELFKRALDSDSKSAFGGIVATNKAIDEASALLIREIFLEVIASPFFEPGALKILADKKNLRLIQWPHPRFHKFEIKAAMGGWLVQERNGLGVNPEFRLMTSGPSLSPSDREEMRGAWRICKHVRSNAIVLVKNQRTVGIGAGQMSRIDSLEMALQKAKGQCDGAILASDAFFPFRDSIDRLKGLGIKAVLQPGGSQRDQDVIDACRELEIPLYFTGERHFRH